MRLEAVLSEGYNLRYRGFKVEMVQDDDQFWWINYTPDLPKEIDLKYNKAKHEDEGIEKAKKAIDEYLSR